MQAAPVADALLLSELLEQYQVAGVTLTVLHKDGSCEDACAGFAEKPGRSMTAATWMEIASLSKTLAAAFACQYAAARDIPLDKSVNALLREVGSSFLIESAENCDRAWAEEVTLAQLMNHLALGMHYVHGFPVNEGVPAIESILKGEHEAKGYERLRVAKKPGSKFDYSGGGFLTLQLLLEKLEKKPIEDIMRTFLNSVGMTECKMDGTVGDGAAVAHGYDDAGTLVPGTRLSFPALAAGGLGTAHSLANFWRHLLRAYVGDSDGAIMPSTARAMLGSPQDCGARDFMNSDAGLGVFVATAGPNKIALHQAANDGFRGTYLICFDGPNAGEGIVALANGDNQAALMLAEVLRNFLMLVEWQGIDYSPKSPIKKRSSEFKREGLKQAEIVNQAYKQLVFDAFMPADGECEGQYSKRQRTEG